MNRLNFRSLAMLLAVGLVTACTADNNNAQPPSASPAVAEVAVSPAPPDGGYTITVSPSTAAGGVVRLVITTNIPGSIEVMAGLSLHGQKEDDPWVGKNEKLRISNGQAELLIDASDLPKGKYDAEVDFYPLWGFQDSISKSTGIDEQVSGTAPIEITGTGGSSADLVAVKSGQRWVMENTTSGEPWHSRTWTQKFGKPEEVEVVGLNPNVIKAYYYSKIDTTVFVNELKGTISHYRLGRASN